MRLFCDEWKKVDIRIMFSTRTEFFMLFSLILFRGIIQCLDF